MVARAIYSCIIWWLFNQKTIHKHIIPDQITNILELERCRFLKNCRTKLQTKVQQKSLIMSLITNNNDIGRGNGQSQTENHGTAFVPRVTFFIQRNHLLSPPVCDTISLDIYCLSRWSSSSESGQPFTSSVNKTNQHAHTWDKDTCLFFQCMAIIFSFCWTEWWIHKSTFGPKPHISLVVIFQFFP